MRRAFERAGPHYDASLPALQRVNAELLERLRFFTLDPSYILDLGAGTCHAALTLRKQFPRARVIALDLSASMLRAAPRALWPRSRFHRVAADANRLPLRDHSIDLAFSSLMLPFCDQTVHVFSELARALKPGALFAFSSLGPDTLHELRSAWAGADDGTHVSRFLAVPQLGDALMQSGLIEPVIDVEQHRLSYPDVEALMRDLKRLGAQNAASSRTRRLTGKGRLQSMIEAYERLRTAAGLPATFEVVIGAAFGAASSTDDRPRARTTGEYVVPLNSVRPNRR
jgi:malonyl-CoA O-methyltransferase